MRINEIEERRLVISSEIDTLLEGELNDEVRAKITDLENEDKTLASDLKIAQRQAERQKTITAPVTETRKGESKDFTARFGEWLQSDKRSFEVNVAQRANPLLSTTNTTMLNKTVDGELSIAQVPGFDFLTQLGVPMITGYNGSYVKVSLNQNKAKFVNENNDASAGDLAPATLELKARTLSHWVDITAELEDMTNPQIVNQAIDSLYYGLGIAAVEDFFKQFEIDAVDSSIALGRTMVFRDLINLDASIPYTKKSPAYVTTPAVASALMTTAGLTNQAPIWSDNDTIRGKKAYFHDLVTAKRIYYADWAQSAMVQFGKIKFTKDIYGDNALKNKTRVYATMEIDSGFVNKAFSKWVSDVSI